MNKWMLLIALTLPFMTSAKTLNRISSYEDSYLLGSYTDSINKDEYINGGFEDADGLQNVEVKFQFSLAVPIIPINNTTAFMFSYTQKSLWQLGNSDISSPFRETNYKPQFFLMHQSNMLLFNNAEFGYMHESNGQTSSLSRSWDRIYGALERIDGPIQYGFRTWYVFADEENNEDILDYLGHYDVWVKAGNDIGEFNTRFHYNFETDKGGVEAGYTLYLNKFVGLYVQAWKGYGETLIDYNYDQTRIGLGMKLIPPN
ncbi:phospholipase A [Aliivibrio logei]|jgi:phospholipase A1|uniref:phospholipase A n=1 Tax=Aliivibrio logei TaxID=688 RepID=UPI0035C8E60B